MHGARARIYEKREQILRLGKHALELLTALVHRAPRRQGEHVERIYELLEEHCDEAMRDALRAVVEDEKLTIAALHHALAQRDGGAR